MNDDLVIVISMLLVVSVFTGIYFFFDEIREWWRNLRGVEDDTSPSPPSSPASPSPPSSPSPSPPSSPATQYDLIGHHHGSVASVVCTDNSVPDYVGKVNGCCNADEECKTRSDGNGRWGPGDANSHDAYCYNIKSGEHTTRKSCNVPDKQIRLNPTDHTVLV